MHTHKWFLTLATLLALAVGSSAALAQDNGGEDSEGGGGGSSGRWDVNNLNPQPIGIIPARPRFGDPYAPLQPTTATPTATPVATTAPPTARRTTTRTRSRAAATRSTGGQTAPTVPPLPDFVPNQLVAVNLDDQSIAAIEAAGYTVLDRVALSPEFGDIFRLEVPSGTGLEAARTFVQGAAPTAIVDLNAIYLPSQDDCVEFACLQRNLVSWPVPELVATAGTSDTLTCGDGVVIGIVDTGINPEHEALADADITLLPLFGEGTQHSRRSHGTAVAAVLVGRGDPRISGLLPGAKIVAVDAFLSDQLGRTSADVFRLVAAIDAISQADPKPQVLNLSLAGPQNALLEKMMTLVDERGIVPVAAVGNEGPNAPPLYPAAYDNVIAVTAIDGNRRIYRRAVQGPHVDFAAPGVRIWTAASVRGAKPKTGTSFAAPFVTASAALAHTNGESAENGETLQSIVSALAADADDLGAEGYDPIYGRGLINAGNLCQENNPA